MTRSRWGKAAAGLIALVRAHPASEALLVLGFTLQPDGRSSTMRITRSIGAFCPHLSEARLDGLIVRYGDGVAGRELLL